MYIFIFIFIQFTSQTFIKFIPNYHIQSNININNLSNNNNNFIIDVLKRQLNEEKIKNQNLINENNILKNNINILNNKISNLNNTIINLNNKNNNYINQIQLLQNQINNNNLNNNNINTIILILHL